MQAIKQLALCAAYCIMLLLQQRSNKNSKHTMQYNTQNANAIANAIANALARTHGVTFAQVQYTTQVKLSAANSKLHTAHKTTTANVQLCNNVQHDVYVNAVKRTAQQFRTNDMDLVDNFVASATYFAHTDCYAITQHNSTQALYLYCIVNSAQSVYYIDNVVCTKQQVAALCTASASAAMLNPPNTVVNVTNNVTHSVQPKNITLTNVKQITLNKQTLTF